LIVRITESRCSRVGELELEAHLGDPVVPVWVWHDRMFTWWSAHRVGHVAQQPGPVERDHLDTGHEGPGVVLAVPLDVDQPSACSAASDTGVGAVGAVHRHARPRVTNPMISSPGTGVQHRETAAPARRRGPRRARRRRGGRAPARAGRTVAAAARPRRRGTLRALRATWRRPTSPTRGARRSPRAARRGRRSSAPAIPLEHRLPCATFCTGRPSRRSSAVSSSRPVSMASSRRSRREPLADLVARPGRDDELQPVLRRPGALDLRGEDLDGVAALSLESSGTSRPLTLAPMQAWPTSVWTRRRSRWGWPRPAA
jgi:hypothetical protein